MSTENNELTYAEQQQLAEDKCRERVADIVLDLMDELNKMGNEEKVGEYFISEIRRAHRTLQQNFFGHVLAPCIRDFAKRYDEDQYDVRNEQSCKFAKAIEPIIKDAYFPFI